MVQFENMVLVRLLGGPTRPGEHDLRMWVEGVAVHYGRKQCVDLLTTAHAVILAEAAPGAADCVYCVEVALAVEEDELLGAAAPIAKQEDANSDTTGWDFDDEVEAEETPAESAPAPAALSSIEPP